MPSRRELVLRAMTDAAEAGVRCPRNVELAAHLREHGIDAAPSAMAKIVTRLALDGEIEVRIHGALFRQVLICRGPESGRATIAPSHGKPPHLVINQSGRHRRRAEKQGAIGPNRPVGDVSRRGS